MADVGRDRGQLILVTGLLVAVAIIGLVMLLNTAIYTENLASRGADQSGREAIEYRAVVIESVGGLIEDENDREHASQLAVEGNVTGGIETIDDYTARNYATGGTVVRINGSTVSIGDGALVRQTDQTRQFRNATSSTDWRLADDVDGTRNFTMRVDDSNLTTTTATNALSDGAFTVRVADGSDEWRAFVYDDGGKITVAKKVDTAGAVEVCSVADSEARIDLTSGTIQGEPCPGLVWAEGVSPGYDVSFADGENVSGSYDLTVNTSGSGTVDTTNVSTGPSNDPYFVPAVYSASFDVGYMSPTLTYRTHVRVAPGEPE